MSAEEGDAAPEPSGGEDAATEDVKADTDADANADAPPGPSEGICTPSTTPQKQPGPQFASSPCSPGSVPLNSTFTCGQGSPVAPPLDSTFTCSPQHQGVPSPGFTSTPRTSAATYLDSTFTRSPRTPKARPLDDTFTCPSRQPQDAAFDTSFGVDSSRSVPMDTTFSRSEVHPDGVKVTYTRALFPDKTIITKETIIPTSQDDPEAESIHERAAELLNSTIPLEDPFEMEDVPEEGCFPKLKPFPIKRTSPRKHAPHCPGVCGGKCQSDGCGTGRPVSAPTGARPRRPLSLTSRGLDGTSSTHSAAGGAACCGGKTARPRRGQTTSLGVSQGAVPKRPGPPIKRRNFSPQRRAVSQPMAVLEQKVETRRTYIMTREGAQVVAEFTDGEDISSRHPPPGMPPLGAEFSLPPLPSCRPAVPPTPIEPYYPASIPQGLNPNQLMEYAMEQIQLPPQIQAQIDARPYKNPNEMLEWAMQEIQLPPQLEDHLQARLQALPPGELLPMRATPPRTPHRPASSPPHAMQMQESQCGLGRPAAHQIPPLTPQRPLVSRQKTPIRPVRLNLDNTEDVFSPCSPAGPQALQTSQASQTLQVPEALPAPYAPVGLATIPPEAKRQRKIWSRHPTPPSMEYMSTADFVGGAALHELPGWARNAWEEDLRTQPRPDLSNWREVCEVRPSSLLDCAPSGRSPRARRQWSQRPSPANAEPMSTCEFTGGGHLDQLPSWARTTMMEETFSGQPLDENSWTDVYERSVEEPSSPCARGSPR